MADFVRHDPGHLSLSSGGRDHSAVDVHGPAGQREGIDLFGVDYFESVLKFRVLKLRGNRGGQPFANARDIRGEFRVAHYLKLLFGLSGGFPAQLDVVVR